MNNLEEWKALKRRYRTITLEEIEEAYYSAIYDADHEYDINHEEVSTCLTGFGNTVQCTLCAAVTKEKPFVMARDCINCMWYIYTGSICMGILPTNTWLTLAGTPPPNTEMKDTSYSIESRITFNKLLTADTPIKLLAAYKARYRYMLKVEKQYKEKQK